MPDAYVLSHADLQGLLDALRAEGYELIGPTVRGGAITYDTIDGARDLPKGLTDRQTPGRYELERRGDGALFGYASPAQSFKRFFLKPNEPLLTIRRSKDGLSVHTDSPPVAKLALIGARACDLVGLERLDRTMVGSTGPDHHYALRRADVFVVALQCGTAASTCFCTSMGTGPEVTSAHDLALTELVEGETSRFVATAGSSAGRSWLERIGGTPAAGSERDRARQVVELTRASITRTLDTSNIKQRLQNNPEHPAWDEVAERCLSCTNCTAVCPTCFCNTVEDRTAIDSDEATRERRWDSCHTEDFSKLHGGPVRSSIKARYRHWLTHKFAHWFDQYGTSGCVGCGRCITWCPVGIDTVAQIHAVRPPGDEKDTP